MENNMNNEEMPMQATTFFSFDSPKGQSSYIKVIGVGGGGGNAVNHMYREGITGVDFIVCNTDMKALGASPVPNKIPLGNLGLGAGGKPEKAKKAAEDKTEDIKEALSHNTQMLFITAGMGGGTGTGAAPVIADIAKNIKLENEENEEILVVAIVTRPFSFEGRQRMEQAEKGIAELRKKVDSIIIIDNDKLFAFGDLTMSKAYALADDVLLTAAKGIAEIISKEGYICRDFQDIKSVMEHSDKALMGIGSGRGENRAKDAIDAATTSVLLDDSDINGAKNVLLYFTSSHEHEMTIREQMEITDYVCQATGGFADVKYGAGYDDDLGDELKVTLIATGFDKAPRNEPEDNRRHVLVPDDNVKPAEKTPVAENTHPDGGMYIISHKSPIDTPADSAEPAKTEPAKTERPAVNIRGLYDDEPQDETEAAGKDDSKGEKDLVGDIKLVTKEAPVAPAPTPAPAPAAVAGVHESQSATVKPANDEMASAQQKTTVAELIHEAFNGDSNMLNSADRIRRIHEILRFDPAGPDKVAGMTTRQMASGEVDLDVSLPHSSQREASTYTISNGKMVQKPTLQDQTD